MIEFLTMLVATNLICVVIYGSYTLGSPQTKGNVFKTLLASFLVSFFGIGVIITHILITKGETE
jgi:hypothetical protein